MLAELRDYLVDSLAISLVMAQPDTWEVMLGYLCRRRLNWSPEYGREWRSMAGSDKEVLL